MCSFSQVLERKAMTEEELEGRRVEEKEGEKERKEDWPSRRLSLVGEQ